MSFLGLVFLSALGAFEIMFVGDSYTAGLGVRESEAYPQLLGEMFEKAGAQVTVINGGVSGDTSAGGLRRINWMLKRADPDLVVIALGGNDALRGLPPQQTKENIETMIERVKAAGSRTVVLGVPAPGNMGESYLKRFNQIFRSLKAKNDVPVLINYIRPVAEDSSLLLSDGLHPNPEGHRLLAKEIFEFLQPIVKKESGL